MTITPQRPAPRDALTLTDERADATAAAPAGVDTTAPRPAGDLLDLLRRALLRCTDIDLDELDARTVRGTAAIRLAGLARAAVALLGGDPRTTLTAGPGVVVVRDLAAATDLLAAATADPGRPVRGERRRPADVDPGRLVPFTAEAARLLATLGVR